MINRAIFTLAVAASPLALYAGTAQAAIVLANPSSFNGEEIVFNDVDAIVTGSKLLGFTNQSHTGYYFEGTTSDGTNLLSGLGGVGQATITAFNSNPPKDPVYITSLEYYRQDGGLFNDTEFRFVKPIDGSQITLFAYDQNNVEYDLGLLTLGGDNRFGIEGINGDSISRIKYSIADGGGVLGHKQTRLDNVTSAVPEPTTWGMMILGIGLVGGALRRRQQPAVRYNFA